MIDVSTMPIESLIGYYEKAPASRNCKAKVMRLSKDGKGAYWIQCGYRGRPENKPARFSRQGNVRKQIKWYLENNYTKQSQPYDCTLKPVSELSQMVTRIVSPTPTVKLQSVPKLEVVEGKTVAIRERVLTIREGQFDHVPEIDSHYHFTELTNDVIDDLKEGKNVLLTGHTGCGKTSNLSQIAARINQPVIRANMNGQTTVGDFVGMWTVKGSDKGSETVWVDGVLPLAMKNGYWLIIDEIDYADPSILASLNSVLEKNGTLTLKEKGYEVVKPHPDFRVIATGNSVGCMANRRSMYQGTNIMNEAFIDRFRVYKVNYLSEKEEAALLMKKVKGLESSVVAKMVSVAAGVRLAFDREELSSTFSFRRLLDWAELTVRHKDLRKAAESVIYSKVSAEDKEVIDGFIRRVHR